GDIAAVVATIHPDAVVEVVGGVVHALVPGAAVDTALLEERLGGAVLRAHSSSYRDAGDAFRALDEARALLALVHGAEIPNTDRPTWETLRVLHGAYYTDPVRMRDFSERTVG